MELDLGMVLGVHMIHRELLVAGRDGACFGPCIAQVLGCNIIATYAVSEGFQSQMKSQEADFDYRCVY